MSIADDALNEIKAKRKELKSRFADVDFYGSSPNPLTMFMAGSPGAGKTEFSISFIKLLENFSGERIVRIDADEIRTILSQYKGGNAHEVQQAAIKGVEIFI